MRQMGSIKSHLSLVASISWPHKLFISLRNIPLGSSSLSKHLPVVIFVNSTSHSTYSQQFHACSSFEGVWANGGDIVVVKKPKNRLSFMTDNML